MFSPIGFALVSAVALAIVVVAPALSYQHWRQAAVTGPSSGAEPGRAVRMAFRIETVIAAIMVIVCFLGTLYAVGTLNELNNEMFAHVRPRAYWTLAVYLVGCVALVVWAVQRWTRRSRLALLVAPSCSPRAAWRCSPSLPQ